MNSASELLEDLLLAHAFFLNMFIVAVACTSNIALSQGLRHTLSSHDNANSWQSQRLCYGLLDKTKGLYCLPVANLRTQKGKIEIESSLNSNEEAATIVSRISKSDLDRAFIEKIFSENNFQAVSGIVRISAVYGETAFSLVPFHFIGAYKISNPGLPDISFASVTTTSISLSHNFLSQNIGPYNFLYTPQIDAGSKVFKTSDFNIVDLTVNKSDDLIETEKWSGPSFSNSVAAISRRPLIPSASLRVLNLTNKEPCEACRNGQIRIPDEAAPSAVATIGTFQNLGYGTIWGGYAAKFNGLTKRFDPATSNLAAIYRIGALDTFFTLAPSLTSFGFMFDSTYYRIGIQYTDEKQENSLFIPRRKFSYVHVALRI